MNHCQFITSSGTACEVRKKDVNCPAPHFYCKLHFKRKAVQNIINNSKPINKVVNSKTTINKPIFETKSTKDDNFDFSEVFSKDKKDVKDTIFKVLSEGDPIENTNNFANRNENPISIIKSILDDDEEEATTLNKKQLQSKKLVDKAFSKQEITELEDNPNSEGEIQNSENKGLTISSLLETSYWMTMLSIEQRSISLKGLNQNLHRNEALKANLELAFKEILTFLGLPDDLGIASPTLIVFISTCQVMITTLIMNNAFDSLINIFYKSKTDDKEDNRNPSINIDSSKYNDLF